MSDLKKKFKDRLSIIKGQSPSIFEELKGRSESDAGHIDAISIPESCKESIPETVADNNIYPMY